MDYHDGNGVCVINDIEFYMNLPFHDICCRQIGSPAYKYSLRDDIPTTTKDYLDDISFQMWRDNVNTEVIKSSSWKHTTNMDIPFDIRLFIAESHIGMNYLRTTQCGYIIDWFIDFYTYMSASLYRYKDMYTPSGPFTKDIIEGLLIKYGVIEGLIEPGVSYFKPIKTSPSKLNIRRLSTGEVGVIIDRIRSCGDVT